MNVAVAGVAKARDEGVVLRPISHTGYELGNFGPRNDVFVNFDVPYFMSEGELRRTSQSLSSFLLLARRISILVVGLRASIV